MDTNFVNIIKRITAEQGEAILGDPARLKGFISDYAKNESKAERLAFGRCIEYGAYSVLKSATDRAATKTALARKVHDGTGIEIALCNDALDALESALFGAAPPAQRRGRGLRRHTRRISGKARLRRSINQPPPHAGDAAPKRKTLPIALVVAAVLIVIALLVYRGVSSGKIEFSNGWKGYSDFDSFSRAADMDEFLGEKLTEDQFVGLMVLGALFSDKMTMDIVSADKLTQRYEVPRSLSNAYRYLVKRFGTSGSTAYLAYSDGDRWYVVSVVAK